ncbi:MAG: hypothetical protein ACI3VB_05875 [Oscillospiraceae bacterium]
MDIPEIAARIRGGRLFHSYIITGASAASRKSAAKLIAKAAVCSGKDVPCGRCRDCNKAEKGIHPDINIIQREKDAKELTVDVMRRVRASASVMPNEASRSVYIIPEADSMNIQAQNAMLKIFEEPPSHAVFLLLAENPELFLPTVRSRCETLRLPPEELPLPQKASDTAKELFEAVRKKDNMALAGVTVSLEKADRSELSDITASLRALALGNCSRPGGITAGTLCGICAVLDEADKYIGANVSAGHIAGLLLWGLMSV